MSDLISRKKVLTILNRHTRSGGRDVDGDYVPPDITIGAKQEIKELPPEQPEPHWIPCSERLPEEDVEVLIAYRYKKGEGNTSHTYIDISTYGQLYFGGNKVENKKHWRQPFAYFESNYEVIAWMPLPAPYQPKEDES